MAEEKISQFLKKHQKIYLDAMVFIYLLENNPRFIKEVLPIFRAVEKGKNQAFSSKLTLTEILVHPYQLKDKELITYYLDFLYGFPHFELVPISDTILVKSAALRADTNLKTPDAIHLGSAIESSVSAFITADTRIKYPDLDIFYLNPK